MAVAKINHNAASACSSKCSRHADRQGPRDRSQGGGLDGALWRDEEVEGLSREAGAETGSGRASLDGRVEGGPQVGAVAGAGTQVAEWGLDGEKCQTETLDGGEAFLGPGHFFVRAQDAEGGSFRSAVSDWRGAGAEVLEICRKHI